MATLIDTNILVDIAVRDPHWLVWSRQQLKAAVLRGALMINPVIYAEFSYRYNDIVEVDRILPETEFRREGLPWLGSFLAAQAFRKYRQSGGEQEQVLPDFLIGAHAALRGYTLLTRDPKTYRTYFPGLDIIAPDTHPKQEQTP
jgi:predicted nucleic acid-binding protein